MGITRQYLRYVRGPVFGVTASPTDVLFLHLKNKYGRFVAVSACEHIFIWDSKTGEKVLTLNGDKHVVTSLTYDAKDSVAVGYGDGVVRVFNLPTGECGQVFSGHKAPVSCIAFDSNGSRLASGGKDTDIVLWDLVNEAGLFRLHGHKGQVTHVAFMKKRNILVSSSKDTFVKFWDLDTQHCFKTLFGHRSEVWCFVFLKSESWLITGAADSELNVWEIGFRDDKEAETEPPKSKIPRTEEEMEEDEGGNEDDDASSILYCKKVGSVMREGKDRLFSLKIDSTERVLACHGSDSVFETFKLCNEEELKKKLQKRQRKMKKKGEDISSNPVALTLGDEIRRLPIVKAPGKLRSFDIVMEGDVARAVLLLSNNSLAFYTIPLGFPGDPVLSGSLKQHSHHSDARTVCFSSDGTSILSASSESIKIWNKASQICVRTIACDYALCSLFAPGDRHCIVGTKSGKLQLFDIAAGTMLEEVAAHNSAVWSICSLSDQRGFVSGSADKDVHFWDFELIKDPSFSDTCKRLTASHSRTLKMPEDVLCVRSSPDNRLLAVSLLDSTVKVFFLDSLKFFLSLYGHKFPVLCMDISYDSSLLVTGGADRNVKIWGLDFGDCHRSIFAHDDSIMCIQFLPKTHMFFSAGKDKLLKQWDADKFNKVITLEGHQGEVWALATSPDGRHVVTSSHDKSLRLWERTEEPLVLEEQELEREAEYEKGAVGEEPVVPGETNKETGLAGKKTMETVASTERLIEAIDVCKEQESKLKEHQLECQTLKKDLPQPTVHPLMAAYNMTCPFRYVLEVIRRIKSSELEKTLLLLPYSYVVDVMRVLKEFLDRNWDVELVCRCLFFLLKVHCNQIATTPSLLPVIDKLRDLSLTRISGLRDVIGFNLAGLQYLQREIDSKEEVALFTDASHRFKEKRKRKKRHVVAV